ncbi:biotin--[acetyl-CoA-carboxylase] ligase [Demequina zhanjiangensis]|uniref:biotin--[biotin carboxyl-carrier protein] ligase n=1 Tax=Demequina zhanjiangensis TaxID=3051659 RepID=A0ABT8G147_9MICO|nr:biotin--[acetyl-CoA-carboxylase] ligase [Demequina sp. SYSU T00b26]MDN4472853.1 biotin--[acetyl-CoA-carboxylase] ligase [Demequina sp. SYSU T00b26]
MTPERPALTTDAVAPLIAPHGPLALAAVVPREPSTNTALAAALRESPDAWPHLSAYIADHQTAGRGRSGRSWETPAGSALTMSWVLRPRVSGPDLAWAPLIVGLAAVEAMRELGAEAWIKWPNDVVVDCGAEDVPGWGTWRKIAGILCEVVGDAVVAGTGVNVLQEHDELPVAHAVSVRSLGIEASRVDVLRALGAALARATALWDARPDEAKEAVERACATVGWDVAVDVGTGAPVTGRAVGLGSEGSLLVESDSGRRTAVLAGDVRVRRA